MPKRKPPEPPAHGGPRPGSGRKIAHPEGPTAPLRASVPAVLIDQLDAWADAQGVNRSAAVTEAVRRLVAPAKRKRTKGVTP